MKIELRNVKHIKEMSEETECFHALVYIDGVKEGTAQNEGHGGSTDVEPRELKAKLDAYGASLPKREFSDGFSFVQDAESLADEALQDYLLRKDLRMALARRILYTIGDGKVYQSKPYPKEVIESFKAKKIMPKNAAVVLNYIDEEEALKIYSAA